MVSHAAKPHYIPLLYKEVMLDTCIQVVARKGFAIYLTGIVGTLLPVCVECRKRTGYVTHGPPYCACKTFLFEVLPRSKVPSERKMALEDQAIWLARGPPSNPLYQ